MLINRIFFVYNSAVLREPLFADVTIREGETLKITCTTGNIQDIITSQILDPYGVTVPSAVGVFTIENATRDASGTYTCLVINTLNNGTINATSTVVIQCKLCTSEISGFISYSMISIPGKFSWALYNKAHDLVRMGAYLKCIHL